MQHLLLAVLIAFPSLLSAQQYVLAAAGSVKGQNGTYFRSDVAIWNLRSVSQKIEARWLPQGSSGAALPPVTIVVPAYSGIQDEDFVGSVMKQGGLGAISFLAVLADGNPDFNAKLTIQSRIWTPQPGTRGFTSQSFDAVRITQLVGDRRIITNQRSEFRYRTNVGIVNLDTVAHTWQVIAGAYSTAVTVPPLSMHLFALPEFDYVGNAPLIRVETDGPGASSWVAYGSSVENVSGDAWTSLAYAASLP